MNTKAIFLVMALACAALSLYVASNGSRAYREAMSEIAAAKSELLALASRESEAERLASLIEERAREIERLKAQMQADAEAATATLRWDLSGAGDDPFGSWLGRIDHLASYLDARESLQIPELKHLTVKDWLEATISESLETEADFRAAAAKLRSLAKSRVAPQIAAALAAYLADSDGVLPTSPLQLLDKMDGSVAPEILRRYRMNLSGEVNGRSTGSQYIIIEDHQVDPIWYSTFGFTSYKGSYGYFPPPDPSQLSDAISKFEDENGRAPEGSGELAPYIKSDRIKENRDEMLRAMATPIR